MRTVRLARLATAVAALSLAPSLAPAQLAGKLVFTPYVGAYAPTTDLVRDTYVDQGTTVALNVKHQTAFASGLNASYWMTDRVAIEAGGLYSSSDMKQVSPEALSKHANIFAGSMKVMMQLLPPESGFNVRFGIGPAFITRGGSAYKSEIDGKITGLTDVGAAASLCTRLALTNTVGLRLRAEDYIYRAKMGFESSVLASDSRQFASRTQHDVVLSAGLQFFLNP